MAAASPFVWGSGGEPLTPEEAKARREEASRIIAQATAGKPIQHWTQGLASVGQAALAALDAKEATAGERIGRELASKELAGLAGSFLGGGAAATPAAAGGGTQAAGGAVPSFVAATGGNPTAAFSPVSGDLAARKQLIVDGLVQRGLSPNAAAAYAGNFAIENNADPIGGVGDNGTAFGLAQWRNDRFRALKSLAASQGKDWRDLGVQLDHVVAEHKGMPAAYQQSLATLDAGRGADLVMRQYERPSRKAMADTAGKRIAMALAAFNGFKPSGGAPSPEAPVAAAEAPGVVQGGNPAAVADAQRVATEGGPRMVLSPQNPAVRLASAGTSDAPLVSPSQFLVSQAKDRDPANQPNSGQRIAQALSPSAPAPSAPQGNSRETIARAMKVMESPYANAGQKQVAGAILQKALTAETPTFQRVESGGREGVFNPRTGQTQWGAMLPDARPEYGLSPIYGTDKNGNPVVIQLSKSGKGATAELPPGVAIARDPIKVDGPTGTALLDPQTRQQVGFIPKDIKGAAVQKAEGEALGAGVTGLSSSIATAEQTLGTIDQIRRHPGRDSWGAQGSTAAWPIIGAGVPGTQGRDFVNLVEQLKGRTFLDAFQSLKGAGAITETEGAKATAAIARLDRAQSREGFDQALRDVESIIRSGMDRARERAGGARQAPSVDDLVKKYGGGR